MHNNCIDRNNNLCDDPLRCDTQLKVAHCSIACYFQEELFHKLWNCSTVSGTVTRFERLFHFLGAVPHFLRHSSTNCGTVPQKSGIVPLCVGLFGYCPSLPCNELKTILNFSIHLNSFQFNSNRFNSFQNAYSNFSINI